METKTDERILTDLLCDCCQFPMYMKKVENGTLFDCSHCDQTHTFTLSGLHFYKMATLFPSMPIEKYPKGLKRKYVERWEIVRNLENYGRFLAGLRSDLEYNELKNKISEAVCTFWKDEEEHKAKNCWMRLINRLKI